MVHLTLFFNFRFTRKQIFEDEYHMPRGGNSMKKLLGDFLVTRMRQKVINAGV